MPNTYERETRTALHQTQEKLNRQRKLVKTVDLWIGIALVAGDLALNFIAPHLTGTRFFSTSFNPAIGPVDIVMIVIGISYIIRGMR